MAISSSEFFKGGFWDLTVFQKAGRMSRSVYEVSKRFPREEMYSLTDQCRRSSRSVRGNIAEAYRKRRYKAHFVSKLSDSDAENSETQVWMKEALDLGYLELKDIEEIMTPSIEIGRMLSEMMDNPDKWCLPERAKR
ncbi:MAG: four helix bundle protein [Flavobacteriales bacterium]|nr:four helix bundle protein [Flavobacteriales bacterium]